MKVKKHPPGYGKPVMRYRMPYPVENWFQQYKASVKADKIRREANTTGEKS